MLVLADHWIPNVHTVTMLGNAGVSFFFVLSGFLISRILLDAKQNSSPNSPLKSYLRVFYLRRSLRIFPIYYLTLGLLFILGDPFMRANAGWFFSYLANVVESDPAYQVPSHLGHLWSLSAEEQLYLIMPLVLWYWPTHRIPALAILLIMTSLLFRGGCFWLGIPNPWAVSYAWLPGCLDGYGVGLAVAWYAYYQPLKFKSFFTAGPLLAVLAMLWPSVVLLGIAWELSGRGRFYAVEMAIGLRFSVSLLGGYLIGYLLTASHLIVRYLLLNPWIQYLGKISYGLYLYHNLIYNIHSRQPSLGQRIWKPTAEYLGFRPINGLAEFIFYTILTLSLATLSWFLIEKPLLRHPSVASRDLINAVN